MNKKGQGAAGILTALFGTMVLVWLLISVGGAGLSLGFFGDNPAILMIIIFFIVLWIIRKK